MKRLNFILILLTVVILSVIGIIFIIGTIYGSIQSPNWENTSVYQVYLDKMNVAVMPFVVSLLVVLGICIPKRLFTGYDLLKINGALLGAALIVSIFTTAKTGLIFLLFIASIIQLIVITLTVIGSKRLKYERTGFFLQIGSALLHLGLIIFLFDFIALGDHPDHLLFFWIATTLIGVGMVSSFYSHELAKALKTEEKKELVISK